MRKIYIQQQTCLHTDSVCLQHSQRLPSRAGTQVQNGVTRPDVQRQYRQDRSRVQEIITQQSSAVWPERNTIQTHLTSPDNLMMGIKEEIFLYLAGLKRDTFPLGKTKHLISEQTPARASAEGSSFGLSAVSCDFPSPSLMKSPQPCDCKVEMMSEFEAKLFINAPYFCSDSMPSRTDGHRSPR